MGNWTGFDFLIFLIFTANTLLGMSRGAMREIISLLSLCIALIIAIKFTVPLASFFNRSPTSVDVVTSQFVQNFFAAIDLGPLTGPMLSEFFYALSLLICFVGTFSICESSLVAAGASQMYSFAAATVSRKIGASLGCIRGYVISLLVISIFTLHLSSRTENSFFGNSFFLGILQSSAVKFDSIISGQNPDNYQQIFENKNAFPADQVLENMISPLKDGSATTVNP